MGRIIRLLWTKLVYAAAGETRTGLQLKARRIHSMPAASHKFARELHTGMWQRPLEFSRTARLGGLQAVRTYAKVDALMYDCWFCQDETTKKNGVLCERCGNIQDVDSQIDYFALLDIPRSFAVNPQTLSQNFRHLQTLVHPDKFTMRSTREQNNSADWSSMLNLAYKTLAAPFQRAQYLLKMYGYNIPEDNSNLNQEFLMEMMEKNEEVEEAETVEQLETLLDKVTAHLNDRLAELTKQFDNKELELACSTLTSMRYYLSLQNTIKAKLEKLAEKAQ